MDYWKREFTIALALASLLLAFLFSPAMTLIALAAIGGVAALVVVAYLAGRSNAGAAPALPEVETVNGEWREVE